MAIPTNLSVAAVSYNGTGIPLVGIVPSGTTQVNVTSNGTTTQDVTNYATLQVIASVPNSYSAGDEGKVVSNGALVAQTSKNIGSNGTVDTTLNNQVVVAVPNSYSASDEGKVVSNGALVAQGSDTVTQNGTVDTTLIDSLTVNVSGGGSSVNSGTFTPAEDTLTASFVIGSSPTHFLVFATTSPYTSDNKRKGALAYLDFDRGMSLMIISNSSGGSTAVANSWSSIASCWSRSGDTLTCQSTGTNANLFNYWKQGITYQWYAW